MNEVVPEIFRKSQFFQALELVERQRRVKSVQKLDDLLSDLLNIAGRRECALFPSELRLPITGISDFTISSSRARKN